MINKEAINFVFYLASIFVMTRGIRQSLKKKANFFLTIVIIVIGI